MKLTGQNRSTRRKTCPSATLSTINPTWTEPGSNPGLRGERLATNRLSHGTAYRRFNDEKKSARKQCYQLMSRHPQLYLWNADIRAPAIWNDRYSSAFRGHNCGRLNDWHSYSVNNSDHLKAEVLKKIPPVPDGRQHKVASRKRYSASSEIHSDLFLLPSCDHGKWA